MVKGNCGPGEEYVAGYFKPSIGHKVSGYCRSAHNKVTPADRAADRRNVKKALAAWERESRMRHARMPVGGKCPPGHEEVHVRGYQKADGTRVAPYVKCMPHHYE